MTNCEECGRPVPAQEALRAVGKVWHTDCFTCDHCNEHISGKYVGHDGNPYHEKCLEELETQDLGRSCGVCKELISAKSGAVAAGGDIYIHPDCFNCQYCQKPFGSDSKFWLQQGKPYHDACLDYQEAKERGRVCQHCQIPVIRNERSVKVLGGVFHPKCFLCGACGRVIDDGKFVSAPDNTAAYHSDCPIPKPPRAEVSRRTTPSPLQQPESPVGRRTSPPGAPAASPRKQVEGLCTPQHLYCSHDDHITCLELFGETLFTGSKDGTLRAFRLEDAMPTRALHVAEETGIWSLRAHRGRMYVGDGGGHVKVYSLADPSHPQHVFECHRNQLVNNIVIERNQLFTSSDDYTAKSFDLGTGQVVQTFTGHSDWIATLQVVGQTLVTAAEVNDSTVKLWDLRTGKAVQTVPLGKYGALNAVVVTDDCSKVYVASESPVARAVDISTQREVTQYKGHTDWVNHLHLRGDVLFTASADWTAGAFSAKTGKPMYSFHGHAGDVTLVKVRDNFLLTACEDFHARGFDIPVDGSLVAVPPAPQRNVGDTPSRYHHTIAAMERTILQEKQRADAAHAELKNTKGTSSSVKDADRWITEAKKQTARCTELEKELQAARKELDAQAMTMESLNTELEASKNAHTASARLLQERSALHDRVEEEKDALEAKLKEADLVALQLQGVTSEQTKLKRAVDREATLRKAVEGMLLEMEQKKKEAEDERQGKEADVLRMKQEVEAAKQVTENLKKEQQHRISVFEAEAANLTKKVKELQKQKREASELLNTVKELKRVNEELKKEMALQRQDNERISGQLSEIRARERRERDDARKTRQNAQLAANIHPSLDDYTQLSYWCQAVRDRVRLLSRKTEQDADLYGGCTKLDAYSKKNTLAEFHANINIMKACDGVLKVLASPMEQQQNKEKQSALQSEIADLTAQLSTDLSEPLARPQTFTQTMDMLMEKIKTLPLKEEDMEEAQRLARDAASITRGSAGNTMQRVVNRAKLFRVLRPGEGVYCHRCGKGPHKGRLCNGCNGALWHPLNQVTRNPKCVCGANDDVEDDVTAGLSDTDRLAQNVHRAKLVKAEQEQKEMLKARVGCLENAVQFLRVKLEEQEISAQVQLEAAVRRASMMTTSDAGSGRSSRSATPERTGSRGETKPSTATTNDGTHLSLPGTATQHLGRRTSAAFLSRARNGTVLHRHANTSQAMNTDRMHRAAHLAMRKAVPPGGTAAGGSNLPQPPNHRPPQARRQPRGEDQHRAPDISLPRRPSQLVVGSHGEAGVIFPALTKGGANLPVDHPNRSGFTGSLISHNWTLDP